MNCSYNKENGQTERKIRKNKIKSIQYTVFLLQYHYLRSFVYWLRSGAHLNLRKTVAVTWRTSCENERSATWWVTNARVTITTLQQHLVNTRMFLLSNLKSPLKLKSASWTRTLTCLAFNSQPTLCFEWQMLEITPLGQKYNVFEHLNVKEEEINHSSLLFTQSVNNKQRY